MEERLKRKIDAVLVDWKNTPGHMPLIVKGARQIGIYLTNPLKPLKNSAIWWFFACFASCLM